MHRCGELRTLAQSLYNKTTIPQSTQVIISKVFTKNINQNDSFQDTKKTKKLQRQVHTSGNHYYNCNTPMTYEPWMDEDIICVLQGSCMPGSTRYCRTNSMFGKLDMADIMQGVPIVRKFSTLSGNSILSPLIRRYHSSTTRSSPLVQKLINPSLMSVLEQKVAYSWHTQTGDLLSFTNTPGAVTGLSLQRYYSTSVKRDAAEASEGASEVPKQLTQRDKLKRAVKEYGSTVIVFHISISLISLGGFYLAVSSGLDMATLLKSIGFSADVLQSKLATGASTFVIAYAVHKMFAPVRIGITLTACPFLVRYLRHINVLKTSK